MRKTSRAPCPGPSESSNSAAASSRRFGAGSNARLVTRSTPSRPRYRRATDASDECSTDTRPRLTRCPADLEQIGEIGAKLDAEGQLMRPDVEITDEYPLVACGVPDELEAVHMDQLAAQSAGGHVGIGQIHSQNRIVFLQIRAEEQ